ncbi:hypothetical protein [Nostoc sp.]
MGEAKRRKQLDPNYGKLPALKFLNCGNMVKTYEESLNLLIEDLNLLALFFPEIGNDLDNFAGVLMIDKSAVISTLKDFGKVFETIEENEKIRGFYQEKISKKGTGCIITGRSNQANRPIVSGFAALVELEQPMMFQLYFGNKESNLASVKELIKLTPPSYIPVMSYADNFTTFHLIRF